MSSSLCTVVIEL